MSISITSSTGRVNGLPSFHQGGGCAVSPSVDGLVELLLPQESVRGTPDATWLLGPGEAKICGALDTQLRGFTLALFTISASRRAEPPTFVTKAGERGNLPGLVRSVLCTTSLEPKLKVCDVFSCDLEPFEAKEKVLHVRL